MCHCLGSLYHGRLVVPEHKNDHVITPARYRVIQGWKCSPVPPLTTTLLCSTFSCAFVQLDLYFTISRETGLFPLWNHNEGNTALVVKYFFFNFHSISSLLFTQCFMVLFISVLSTSRANTSLKYPLSAFPALSFSQPKQSLISFFLVLVLQSWGLVFFVGFLNAVVHYPSCHHCPLCRHHWTYSTAVFENSCWIPLQRLSLSYYVAQTLKKATFKVW